MRYNYGYEGGKSVGWPGFEEVAGLYGSGGYDWSEIRVFRRLPDGLLMWAESAGCSCNSFEGDVDSDEFKDLRATDREFHAEVMGMPDCYATGPEKVEFLAEVAGLLREATAATVRMRLTAEVDVPAELAERLAVARDEYAKVTGELMALHEAAVRGV